MQVRPVRHRTKEVAAARMLASCTGLSRERNDCSPEALSVSPFPKPSALANQRYPGLGDLRRGCQYPSSIATTTWNE